MSVAIQIWRAGPGDAARVLAARVFDNPANAQATLRFLGKVGLADPRNILLVADLDGSAVGFVSGTVMDHPDKPRGLFVQELGVNEAAQRRGIARTLLAALRAEGRAMGCTATWVLTEEDNAAARATYSATGASETTGVVMYEWTEAAAD